MKLLNSHYSHTCLSSNLKTIVVRSESILLAFNILLKHIQEVALLLL